MPQDFPDLSLLKRGDEQAWCDAFRSLWGIALRAAQHPEARLTFQEAEEAAADALRAIVSQIEKIGTVEDLKRLLVAIAYYKAISLARAKSAGKRGQKITVSLEANPTMPEEEMRTGGFLSDHLTEIELQELTKLVEQALSNLKTEDRLILTDRMLQGASYHELSQKYRMPTATLQSKVARGLTKVRAALDTTPRLLQALNDFLR